MKNDKFSLTALLSLAAIAGNILFTLWILYNGINEGFQGTTIEKLSYVTLMGLLVVNAFLLIRNRRQQSRND
jgi:SNF family Na+-dependent transporter